MKILMTSSVPITYKGGSEKVVLDLSKGLSEKHDVVILQTNLYEQDKEFERYSKIGNVEVITCKNDRFFRGYGYSKDFKKTLKSIYKNFDLIHIHGHGRAVSNYTLRLIGNKKPVIYTAHGFFHTQKSGKIKQLHDFFFKRIIRKVAFCTALTEIEERRYLELGVPKEKIRIIPNGIDLEKFITKIKC